MGAIVIAYKTNPYKVLILENKETGNVTTPSGAIEKGETLEEAAARELKEELGWVIDPKKFQVTPIKQEFVYGPQKKERAGDQGINQVFLLDADNLPEPQETSDTKDAKWLPIEEAVDKITFNDLKEVVRGATERLLHPGNPQLK